MNGSSDGTARVAQEIRSEIPQVQVIDISAPIGKGGAILEGFRNASGSRIVFADADSSTHPASLLTLLDSLDRHDLVIGSRRLPESRIIRRQPPLRRLLSLAFNMMVRGAFELPYRDTQCGAKALTRDAASRLVSVIDEMQWAFDIDLLLAARALKMSVSEVPVVWSDSDGSTLRIIPALKQVGNALWRLRGFRRSPTRMLARRLRRGYPWGSDNNTHDVPGSLRILALNWRDAEHPQAGGAELNLFEQARRWSHAGHEVTVVCAVPAGKRPGEVVVNGVRVKRMGGRFSVYPLAAWFLFRKGRKYDCILDVANGIPFFAPLFTSTPATLLVHHVHARQWFTEFSAPVAAVGWLLESRIVKLVYRHRPMIAVSSTTRDALISLGIPPAQVRVVYNGVERPGELPRLNRSAHRIAYVGRIKRYKRLDLLVRAVADLREEFSDIHLDIAGDGDARPFVEDLVKRLDLSTHVTVHGFVDEKHKARVLAGATVFATPSMHEGWGLSVIEANAHGCPAVAFDVPGLRVAINDEQTGLLARNDSEFRSAIARLLSDDELRKNLSDNALQWANSFDWESAARDTLWVMVADDALTGMSPNGLERAA